MSAYDFTILLQRLCSLTERVVLFPVRHHSPACARAVRELILRLRPAAVLIEGPTDFNNRMGELMLPHRLPVAVYTWVRLPDAATRGAFYPFCRYSPEWQALKAAWNIGAETGFIDLPWVDLLQISPAGENRYADAALRRGEYTGRLCQELEVEGFDALWDKLAEQDDGLSAEEIMRRTHHFCAMRRLVEGDADAQDLHRESYMAARIQECLTRLTGQILVVTGGYHSLGLLEFLNGEREYLPHQRAESGEHGIALTPYAYEDLDSLTGYDAGMPNPGFYDAAWEYGHAEAADVLLQKVAAVLRGRKQTASTADLIAVKSTAMALASLRGHEHAWRRDLMDGIIAALVKDEAGDDHPFVAVLHEVLRGGQRGLLAEGTPAPPFVHDLRTQLAQHGLEPEKPERMVINDLTQPGGLARSRLLHRLAVLGLPGFQRTGGVDFSVREDLSGLTETWSLRWVPEFEARAVEFSRYGPSVREAAAARLRELAATARGADAASKLIVQAAEAGLAAELAGGSILHDRLEQLIRSEPDFARAAGAVEHLLYLYQFDEVLGTSGLPGPGILLREAWERSVWLINFIGAPPPEPAGIPAGFHTLVEALERAGTALALPRRELIEALQHLENHSRQLPLVRGAAAGALWILGVEEASGASRRLRAFADPAVLGDYLTGLFTLARELASREPALLHTISETVSGFSPDDFLAALPALRLAFTFFPPREKFDLARVLFGGNTAEAMLATRRLSVSAMESAAAAVFENRLLATLRKYGLREPLTAFSPENLMP